MSRFLPIVLVLVLIPVPGEAGEHDSAIFARSVEIVPSDGVAIRYGERRYRGRMVVGGFGDGLSVGETTSAERYLEGIAEVPFGWDEEALKAQAVAARTYLGWTLGRGRATNGAAYGYDICATTACQVYAGVGLVEGPEGGRWKAAVEATADEILIFAGSPAQALYSSTTGGRTRNVEDVFPGSSPRPYLVAVDSQGEDSPFVEWEFVLDAGQTRALLVAAGLAEGDVRSIEMRVGPDGTGPWKVTVVSDVVITTNTWDLRTMLNRAAAKALPDVLPARRPDGRRYPQTILSPSFRIDEVPGWIMTYVGPPIFNPSYRFLGSGWGHLVGMSQYGAQAMAKDGSDYTEILAHYYGGLAPQAAGALLADTVTIGLATKLEEVLLVPDGPVTVIVGGVTVADDVLGEWYFESVSGGVLIRPPVGLGLVPTIEGVTWFARVVRIDLNTTAIVSIDRGDPVLRAAGTHYFVARKDSSVITISVSNPQGHHTITIRVPVKE